MNRSWIAGAVTAAWVALGLAPLAQATPLVSGQTLSLPLTEDSDGPVLKFLVTKAVFVGSYYQTVAPVPGETRAEREARANQVVLDNPDGRDLVKFVRFAADDLRERYSGAKTTVTVSAVFTDGLKVDQGKLMGDALKAGFTLGIGTPATIAINFNSHMEITIGGPDGVSRVLTCDAQRRGGFRDIHARTTRMVMMNSTAWRTWPARLATRRSSRRSTPRQVRLPRRRPPLHRPPSRRLPPPPLRRVVAPLK